MKKTHLRNRPAQIVTALGAMLVTASCAGLSNPAPTAYGAIDKKYDGGTGQLIQYCDRLYSRGDLATAIGLCDRAHQLDPTNPEPLFKLAEILTQMGEIGQATIAYKRILDTSPENTEAHYRLGKAYVSLEQYDLALTHLETARKHRPEDPRIYNALGVANGLLGAHAAAQEAFGAGLKASPRDLSLRSNLGLSLALSGRYVEGITILEEVAANPAADDTSRQNLDLAQGLYSTHLSDVALASLEMLGGAPGPDGAQTAATADDMPVGNLAAVSGPVDSTALKEPASAPIALSPATREQYARKPDASDDMFDTDATAGRSYPDWGENQTDSGSSNEPASPTQTQTAALTTGVTDADRSVALFGDYLSVDVNGGTSTAADNAISQRESRVAALPSSQPEMTQWVPAVVYAVQFASYRSEERARKGWIELRRLAPDLLAEIEPEVRRADLGADKGIFYRLRTGLQTKDAADLLCMALKERGMDCLIVKEQPEAGGSSAG
ncbi:MAG: tetratricopeptide repeat protein [Kiloniellales bacterium]|jgi:Flp pilus assembly protein TadD